MAQQQHASDAPKPFVFVLMPFAHSFDAVYKSIKQAASEAGCYAERVDEQDHDEEIVERIRNQISKADFLIAVTDDRNPNVTYEIGYAHALGKLLIFCTRDPETIPFDLKMRPHVVFTDAGDLELKLQRKFEWAKGAIQTKAPAIDLSTLRLEFSGQTIHPLTTSSPISLLGQLPFITLYNDASKPTPALSDVHLHLDSMWEVGLINDSDGTVIPYGFTRTNAASFRTYRLEHGFPALPPGGCASIKIRFDRPGGFAQARGMQCEAGLSVFVNGDWLMIPFSILL